MIKNLLLTAGVLLSLNHFAQNFSVNYSFLSVVGGSVAPTGPLDPTPVPTAANITCGQFAAVNTGTASTASGVFSFSGWGLGATNNDNTTFTGAIDLTKYYGVTITPANNYAISITGIAFQATRSGTGVRNWGVRTSANGYASNVGTAACNNTNIAIQGGDTYFWSVDSYTAFASQNICTINTGTTISNVANPLTIRFYGWNAEGTGGTFRIDSATFNGTAIFGAGIKEYAHSLAAPFKLSPNPSTNGVVMIEPLTNDYTNFQIMDILGNIVLTEANDKSGNKIKVNVSNLAEGTYFVRFNTAQRTYSEKLIITK
jgi:hypothetical protein